EDVRPALVGIETARRPGAAIFDETVLVAQAAHTFAGKAEAVPVLLRQQAGGVKVVTRDGRSTAGVVGNVAGRRVGGDGAVVAFPHIAVIGQCEEATTAKVIAVFAGVAAFGAADVHRDAGTGDM